MPEFPALPDLTTGACPNQRVLMAIEPVLYLVTEDIDLLNKIEEVGKARGHNISAGRALDTGKYVFLL